MKQQADPRGTLSLKQYKQEALLAESASLAAAGDMSKSLVASICPRRLIVSTGQLKDGLCSRVGCTAADGEMKQQTGLCGTLTFKQYKQEASMA